MLVGVKAKCPWVSWAPSCASPLHFWTTSHFGADCGTAEWARHGFRLYFLTHHWWPILCETASPEFPWSTIWLYCTHCSCRSLFYWLLGRLTEAVLCAIPLRKVVGRLPQRQSWAHLHAATLFPSSCWRSRSTNAAAQWMSLTAHCQQCLGATAWKPLP